MIVDQIGMMIEWMFETFKAAKKWVLKIVKKEMKLNWTFTAKYQAL